MPPPGPRWGPSPAAAAAPGGGGGMKPPSPPLPPRSPAEGREGSAPRQDPPLRPPPPPRHLHPFPRSLPGSAGSPAEQERERERGGETGGKNPPARARRGGSRGCAERSAEPLPPQGTVPCSASRWRCGRGRGAEQRRICPGLPRPSSPRGKPG